MMAVWDKLLDEFILYLQTIGKLQEPPGSFSPCRCAFSQLPECKMHAIWNEYAQLFKNFRNMTGEDYYYEWVYVNPETKKEIRQKYKL